MSEKTTSYSGGIGFVGLLQIVFITLKLTGIIEWSWWWVLSPIWMSVLFTFFLVLFMVLVFLALNFVSEWRK